MEESCVRFWESGPRVEMKCLLLSFRPRRAGSECSPRVVLELERAYNKKSNTSQTCKSSSALVLVGPDARRGTFSHLRRGGPALPEIGPPEAPKPLNKRPSLYDLL